RGIGQGIGEMAHEDLFAVVALDLDETFDDLNELEAGEALARRGVGLRRFAQRQVPGAEGGERELAVISRRIGGGALELACRLGAVAALRSGATEPVFGARQAERHAGDGLDGGEMARRGGRLVEELERQPAGMEL